MSEYIRSPLIRIMYEKLEHQNKHLNSDHNHWYEYHPEYMENEFRDKFIRCKQDEETSAFLENCFVKSDWLLTHFCHAIAKAVLTWFTTSTSINGLLGRGSMFVFSSAQFLRLLNVNDNFKFDYLLDLVLSMSEYIRSPLIRIMYEKLEHQNKHLNSDHNHVVI